MVEPQRPRWTGDVLRGVSRLVARYQLPESVAAALLALVELVVEDPLAPTAVRDPIRALEDHLADSLVALELEQVRSAGRIADLGAGAGFPGLPLALALPAAEVSLVESSARKCAFIQRAITVCGAANAHSVHARAETWPAGIEHFDLVTARALGPLSVAIEYAAPLLRIGGSLVVWRGRRDREAEEIGAIAARELGLESHDPRLVDPYPGALHRHLQVVSKVSATPVRFPRRAGMARKRPLGPSGASEQSPSDRHRR